MARSKAAAGYPADRSRNSRDGNQPLKVQVVFFGSLSESVQADPLAVEAVDGETVGALRQRLCRDFEMAAPVLSSAMVAIDTEYGSDDTVLKDGAEVAFLPPVSGG